MIKKLVTLVILIMAGISTTFSQHESFIKIADSLYKAKQYKPAAENYLQAARLSPKYISLKNPYYNAACCYALANDKKRAEALLDSAIFIYGSKNFPHILQDSDLENLHGTKYWEKLEKYAKKEAARLSDPAKVKLVTSDIHNFWKAYDMATKDTANRKKIYTEEYFGKASLGLQDYFETKIGSVNSFVKNLDKKPEFYKAIRNNTLAIDRMKPEIQGYLNKLKQLYDAAIFPDLYFVIGRWNSAGTVSDNGMLLGVDQQVKTPDIPLHELNLWEKNNFQNANALPIIVTHELIHSQQMGMKEDTTLLFYAIVEGMADFMCELITGKQPSARQHEFAKTRKKQIWEDFKKEMYLQRHYNWIANGDQERPDHPADLGYYVGYEICKAYYDQASDKKQAIKDFFAIKDYAAFLKESGYEEKMAAMP